MIANINDMIAWQREKYHTKLGEHPKEIEQNKTAETKEKRAVGFDTNYPGSEKIDIGQ